MMLLPVIPVVSLSLVALGLMAYRHDDPTRVPVVDGRPPQVEVRLDEARTAALPRDTVDTRLSATSGDTIRVGPRGNLQRAIDRASGGDVILLTPGATYQGPFRLRRKNGNRWITIRTAAPDSTFAPAGKRVMPGAGLPRLVVRRNGQAAVTTEPGAAYYRLIGLEITATPDVQRTSALVLLGAGTDGQPDSTGIPHHLILDRVYVHGHGRLDLQRCVALNTAWSAVIDSHLGECHSREFDSQAIAVWNGPGPFKIVNNHLEGAGMAILFGGARSLPGLVPSDVEIRHNHMYKPPEWHRVWVVKNGLELKTGNRVLIEENIIDGSWRHGQVGFAFVMVSMGAAGQRWHNVQDITVRRNVIRNVGAGINIGATYAGAVTPAQRLTITDNLMYDVNTPDFAGDGRLVQIIGAVEDVRVERNTFLAGSGSANQAMIFDTAPTVRLTVRDNIMSRGRYGVFGSGAGEGINALRRFAPDVTWGMNLLVGRRPQVQYPNGTLFAPVAEVGFASAERRDFRLITTSPYRRRGTGGTSLGADVGDLRTRLAHVVSPTG